MLSSLCPTIGATNSSGEILGRENSKEERQEVERRKENPEVGCLHPRGNGSAEIL